MRFALGFGACLMLLVDIYFESQIYQIEQHACLGLLY